MSVTPFIGRGLLIAALLVGSALPGFAQGVGEIRGNVLDSSGAILPGATVTLTNTQGAVGGNQETVSDDRGTFAFVRLVPGTYSVRGQLPGFQTVTQGNIVVNADATARADLRLSVGAIEEAITVTTQVPLLDTTNAGKQTTITKAELDALPNRTDIWSVTKVLPTTLVEPGGEQVVFVSTFDVDRNKDKTLDDTGGVFRLKVNTTTGTAVVEKISSGNGALTGLPGGHYTDLAFDDVNDIIYAASPSRGVFSFVVGGDGQWHLQANGFQMGADTDADTKDDLLQRAARIKLAIHESTGTLYAGVIGPVNNTGQFNITATGLGRIGLFKTEHNGTLWTAMPSLPGSVDNATLYGLNPGQQGDKHFSMIVDPTNKDIIYVGGDGQGSTTNNQVGLTNAGSGRIFMFSGGNWTQIVGNNADGTAPHADSRGMLQTRRETRPL